MRWSFGACCGFPLVMSGRFAKRRKLVVEQDGVDGIALRLHVRYDDLDLGIAVATGMEGWTPRGPPAPGRREPRHGVAAWPAERAT